MVGGCALDATTVDISETGICLQTGVELERGTTLHLHLEPRATLDTPRVEATVVWVRRAAVAGDEEAFLCGLHFAPMTAEVKVQIGEIIGIHAKIVDLPEAEPADVVELGPPLPGPATINAALVRDREQRACDERHALRLLGKGHDAALRGDLDSAVVLLEQAVDQMPDSAEAVEELARVVYIRGDVSRAAQLFDRALRLRQEHP